MHTQPEQLVMYPVLPPPLTVTELPVVLPVILKRVGLQSHLYPGGRLEEAEKLAVEPDPVKQMREGEGPEEILIDVQLVMIRSNLAISTLLLFLTLTQAGPAVPLLAEKYLLLSDVKPAVRLLLHAHV